MRHRWFFLLATAAVAASGCASARDVYDARVVAQVQRATFPPGPEGALIAHGQDILERTPQLMKPYVRARMACVACHLQDGKEPRAGSLIGAFARFPMWNPRAHRFITVQDRIAECFLYSMNGRPPPYWSRDMISLTAYLAWLSHGAVSGSGVSYQEYVKIRPGRPPDRAAGASVYAQKCQACHGADGAGNGPFPPLWGPTSFNNLAGMSDVSTMARFVKYNMPQNAPGTLSSQEAFDVAAFVLGHARPVFDKRARIAFPPEPANFF